MLLTPQQAAAKIRDRADKAFRLLVLAAHKGIVENTPVDTGRARGNWMISVAAPQWSEQPPDKSEKGTVTILREFTKRNSISIDEIAYVVNGVEYIEYLENGTDKFPPFGMVKMTMEQLKGKAAEIAVVVRQGRMETGAQ